MSSDVLAAVPLLHVGSMTRALEFYCDQLGFEEVFRFQPEPAAEDPIYLGIRLGPVLLHISSFTGDGKEGGVVVIFVNDIDAYCTLIVERGVDIGEGIFDQSWGNRECYLVDPFNNQIRLTQVMK